MTDAIEEEFIKLVGDRPADLDSYVGRQAAAEHVLLQNQWDAKLEGFRLARSNGVPAGEADMVKRALAISEKYPFTWEKEEADRRALDAYAEKLGNVRYAWAAIREHIGSDVTAGGSFEKLINAMDAAIAQQKETAT